MCIHLSHAPMAPSTPTPESLSVTTLQRLGGEGCKIQSDRPSNFVSLWFHFPSGALMSISARVPYPVQRPPRWKAKVGPAAESVSWKGLDARPCPVGGGRWGQKQAASASDLVGLIRPRHPPATKRVDAPCGIVSAVAAKLGRVRDRVGGLGKCKTHQPPPGKMATGHIPGQTGFCSNSRLPLFLSFWFHVLPSAVSRGYPHP
ncbi:hypothetical protein MAPG_06804 [Magnaporthiopsis poae ATCC 64411]|uniref:Uncharacterized protein n=1 Tax=Magnaporthiopsis poae (strain ATCC 64411 / 73-15) TaxID=644358 RepID=A0A0C4E311_MAGP6|nr:hypothetical protein MAPG_06804 [Magnaporthiopsis poae ATCC 64411]